MKRCSKCRVEKAVDEFGTSKAGISRSWCRPCDRTANLARYHNIPKTRAAHWRAYRKFALKRYGLTPADYDHILAEQTGGCAICGETCSTGYHLAVDHDHVTGVVRGLLCLACNTGIGKFRDDPALILKAAEYVRSRTPGKGHPCVSSSTSKRTACSIPSLLSTA